MLRDVRDRTDHGDRMAHANRASDFESALRRALSTRGSTGLEVEFRLGSKDPRTGNFAPGVSLPSFERLEKALETSGSFAEQTPACTTDYYFRGTEGRLEEPGEWVVKDKVSTVDSSDGRVRASAAYEIRRPPLAGANPRGCSFFRKKNRRSWLWREIPWRVDLTRVQSTEDLDSEDYVYEVEIELVADDVVYSVPLDALLTSGRGMAEDLSRMCVV